MHRSVSGIGFVFALCALIVAGVGNALADPGWPGLRGPNYDGSVQASDWIGADGAALTVGWKQALGSGYSGVVATDGRVVTMFAEGDGDFIAAFDSGSGDELWRYHIADTYKGHDGSHDGPISTPLMAGDRIYGLGAWGHLFAVDAATGKEIWSTHLVEDHEAKKPHYGFTTSPIIADGVLIVEIGAGEEGKAIAGFSPDDGSILWAVGDDQIEYHSPVVATLGGKEQVLAAGAKTLNGLDAKSGEVLWTYEHQGDDRAMGGMTIVPVPAGDDRVFILNKIDSSMMLNITPGDDGEYTITELWTGNSIKSTYVIPVYHDGYIYGMNNRIFTCVDAATGEARWRSREPGDGFPTIVGDHLVVVTKPGTLHIAETSAEGYHELARIDLFDEHSWAEAAFAGGHLFARSMASLARVDIAAVAGVSVDADAAGQAIAGTEFASFLAEIEKAEDKSATIGSFLESQTSFPIIEDTGAVHFVYQGEAQDVGIVGDMIGFRREDPMTRVAGTDLYYYSTRLEPDAAVSYGFIVDYADPVADPRNPLQADGLFGDVSWFGMPAWRAPAFVDEADASRQGRLEPLEWTSEVHEGKTRQAEVYLPAGYDSDSGRRYPTIYVHGGKTALEKGAMKNSLDQLIGTTIEPVIAVFVFPDEENRGDLWEFEKYSEMIVKELVPSIDENYRTIDDRMARANIGSGGGGNVAIASTFMHSDLFARVGSQASTLELVEVEPLVTNADEKPLVIYMEWGTYHIRSPHEAWDRVEESRKTWTLLRERGYRPAGGEVPEGYAWAFWRGHTDEMLSALFPLRPKS